jgi:23S rRNA pseudouridine955/2504/2580 synthase
MASINAPLVGDELYGGKPFYLSQVKRKYRLSNQEEAEQPVMARAALHAAALHLPYPEGETLSISAPYPKDYDTTLKLLRKFDSWD